MSPGNEDRLSDPPPPFTIAYQDEHLMVVDKGSGVVVHPARGHRESTLAQLLAPLLAGGDPERAGIVHRLDRDTSGCSWSRARRRPTGGCRGARAEADRTRVPGARRGTPAGALRDDRRADRTRPARTDAHECRRQYIPPRKGSWPPRGTRWSRGPHPFHARVRAARYLAAAAASGDGAHAPDPRPPAGDRPPGVRGSRVRHGGHARAERQFLHATRLAFDHPLTGERVDVRSPLPADLTRALRQAPAPLSLPRAHRAARGRSRSAILERQSDLRPVRPRIAALPGGATLQSRPPGPLHPHGNQRTHKGSNPWLR